MSYLVVKQPGMVRVDLLPPLVFRRCGVDMLPNLTASHAEPARRALLKRALRLGADRGEAEAVIGAAFVEAFA